MSKKKCIITMFKIKHGFFKCNDVERMIPSKKNHPHLATFIQRGPSVFRSLHQPGCREAIFLKPAEEFRQLDVVVGDARAFANLREGGIGSYV